MKSIDVTRLSEMHRNFEQKSSKKLVKTPKQSWAKKFQDLNTDVCKYLVLILLFGEDINRNKWGVRNYVEKDV